MNLAEDLRMSGLPSKKSTHAAQNEDPYSVGRALDRQGTLFLADLYNHRVRTVSLPYLGFSGQELVLPSEDGSELYHFDPTGRHLRTLHALTGAVVHRFTYDPAGRLGTVGDGDGNRTTIERSATGDPTALVAPDGQRTLLTLDANSYLASLTTPTGEPTRFAYTGDGLLTTFTTPRGYLHQFAYDALGRLTQD
ncbi:MAG: hypothetical protein ACREA0_34170, partial [bacterium]